MLLFALPQSLQEAVESLSVCRGHRRIYRIVLHHKLQADAIFTPANGS
jgi:hypothetical protein